MAPPPPSSSSQITSRTLYVDTNLDTHFALSTTEEDTIAEVIQKISSGHRRCFPQIGDITVSSLKVERGGRFYHLLDTMILKNVFDVDGERWFLHVEAASNQLVSSVQPRDRIYIKDGGVDDSEKEIVGEEGNKKKKKRKRERDVDVDKEQVEFSKALDSCVVVETDAPEMKKRKKSKINIDVDLKTELQNDDPVMIPETTNTIMKIEELDAPPKPVDDTGNMEAQDPPVKRKKKSRKSKNVSAAQLENVDGAEPQNGEAIVSVTQAEGPISNDYHTSGREYTSPNKAKDVGAQETTKNIDDKLEGKSVKPPPSTSYTFTDEGIQQQVEAQDHSGVRKKKKRKPRNSNTKNKISSSQVEHVQGAGEALVVQNHPRVEPEKVDAIVSDTEGVKTLNQEHLNTPAEGSVHIDYQGSGHKDTTPEKAKVARVQEITGNIGDKVEWIPLKPPPSTSYTFTDEGIQQQVEAQDPYGVRKKKKRKPRYSNAKNNISSSQVEHVQGAGEALAVQNHPPVEPEKGDAIVSDTEGLKASNMEHLNTLAEGTLNVDHQGSGHMDTSPEKAKVVRVQETTETIDDKVQWESVHPPPSTSNAATNLGMKQQVEAQDPTDVRKKKKKKTKNSTAKNNIPSSLDEHVQGADEALVVQNHPGLEPEKGDTILSDTEGGKASNLEHLKTLAEGSVNIDYKGSGHKDTSPEKVNVVRVQEITENIDDTVHLESVQPPPSTSIAVTDLGVEQQVEAQDPSYMKKKRAKKTKNSNAKNSVSASQLENVDGAGYASLVQEHPVVEPQKRNTSLSEAEGVNASKVECLNTPAEGSVNNDYQGSRLKDICPQEAKIDMIQETADDVDGKVTRQPIRPPPSTSNNFTDPGIKQQVGVTEDLSFSTKGNEEGEKATPKKRRKSKKDGSARQSVDTMPDAGHNDGFRTDSLCLSQLANNVESGQTASTTAAEGSDNNDYQGSKLKDISPQEAKIDTIQETADDVDGKVTRQPIMPPLSTSNNFTDPGIKQQVGVTEDLSLSTKGNEEGEKAIPKRRRKSKKDGSSRQSVDTMPDAGHNDDFRTDSLCLSQLANNVESGQTASNAHNCSVGGHHLVSGSIDASKDNKEVLESAGEKVDLGDHGVPGTDSHELVIPTKQLGEKGFHQRNHDKELKGNKKTKMHNMDSTGITPDMEIPPETVDYQMLGTRTRPESSDTSKLQKMRTNTNSSEKAQASAGAVHSSLKVFRVEARKPVSNKVSEVGSAAPDTVFARSSSESSADSDASTMSPSDTSSSSDHSEGEGFNSPRKGSNGGKAENGGNKHTAMKNMDLDSILRSSRSYKKAKLTASQSQLDETESEAVEFVLDTQFQSTQD